MSERRIRVAYLIDRLHRAGAQVHLGQLAAGLDRSRFAPSVACLLEGGPVADALRESGVPVEVLGLGRLYGPRALAGLLRLARRWRAERPDVVHTYLVSANICGSFAARLARAPAVVTTRRDTGFSRNWRLRLCEEWLVNPTVDRVVAVSDAVAEVARRERGLARGRVVTIENGVDPALWDPERQDRDSARREFGIAPQEAALGVVARLTPVKGHVDFLHAAARIARQAPQARFFVIGDGELRAALERLAEALGIAGRTVFTGARTDVPRLLAMLDVVAVPSHTEGLSNALLEAMAMQRPVVATSVGGNPGVLQDGRTGRLVPARDPEQMANALLELLENPRAALALGQAARRSVEERFGVGRMVARHQELYSALSARAGG